MKGDKMEEAIKARAGENKSVIYEFSNGKTEEWSGGDRNWRNNNPGNVRDAGIAWNGRIGSAGGFCVFSNPEYGKRVTRKILDNRREEGKTLAQAIEGYAPSSENNTQAYLHFIERYAGVSAKDKLKSLSSDKMEKIAQGIFIHEGTQVGIVKVVKKPTYPTSGKYIWHTSHDEKVRASHASRDGKEFDFANPPKGGNPGEDYNCRCSAEIIQKAERSPLKKLFGR